MGNGFSELIEPSPMLAANSLWPDHRGARSDEVGAGKEGRTSFELAGCNLQVNGEMGMAAV
jgi:hypothetical protein